LSVLPFAGGAEVEVPDPFQDRRVEPVGAGGSGVVGGLVGVEQGAGHRQCPQLPGWVGIGDGTKISEEMRAAPGVDGGQVRVSGVAISHEDAGELREHPTGVDIV
jgi:hypothetical protein